MDGSIQKPQKRWNAENYKQFNIALKPDLIDAFRETCAQSNMSMRAVLVLLMSEYVDAPHYPRKTTEGRSYPRRSDRRKATAIIVEQLEAIHTAELQYMENIPENLKNSSRHDAASHATDSIAAAIDLLSDAFDG